MGLVQVWGEVLVVFVCFRVMLLGVCIGDAGYCHQARYVGWQV